MHRIYFKHNRSLLTGLCQCAYKSLLTFLRKTVRLKDGIPGVVMAIHTFGEYPEKFHSHIHAIVTDGLFADTGSFHVMKRVDLKPLEELFRAEVFKFLIKEGKITDDLVHKLMAWKHSGFSVDNGVRIERGDEKGREAIAQYIMRNVFSTEKITYVEKTGNVLYRSKMQKGKNRKNFVVYSAEEFIAAITQHIPKKNFQMVRYYGWYWNKSRGMRAKIEIEGDSFNNSKKTLEERILDVSKHRSKNSPSLTWRECIKRIWKEAPLICPECQHEMRIISFITEMIPIEKILKYLELWDDARLAMPNLQRSADSYRRDSLYSN